MYLVSRYPFLFIGVVVVALGILIEVLSRLFVRTDEGRTSPPKKRPGRTLARLSLVIGMTLIVLGLVTLPK